MALLGDAIQIRKNNLINIKDDADYLIAGIQNYGKGVVIRRSVKGSELTMKKYQIIEENQLMWCKVDTKNGAFGVTKKEHIGALASTNMCLADINKEKYLPVFIETLFAINPFHEWITKYSLGSTNRKYLTPIQLIERVEIPDLSIEQQKNFLLKVSALNESGLVIENQNQSSYLKKLRQAILQEAVEGKLTADWRKENPVRKGDPDFDAEALLEKIQAEKEKLIKEGEIKKQKPLAPIKADEVPFELPQGWVWCKIDSLVYSLKSDIRTGPFGSALHKHDHKIIGYPVWGIESIGKDGSFQYKNKIFIDDAKAIELKSFKVTHGDIIISRSGTVGELCLIPEDASDGFISTNLLKISLNKEAILPEYFTFLFKGTKSINDQLDELCFGTTRIFITQTILSKLMFPLPSIPEQLVIVNQIKKNLSMVDELEKQVSERKEQSEQLMQAVLREAFEGGNHA